MLYNYNAHPAAVSGQGAYGKVPGQLEVPPSIYEQEKQQYAGMEGLTSSAGDLIGSQLKGTLSPDTMRNIGDYAAARGISMGQPNSPISNLIGMNVTGTTTEQLQQQGFGNYMNFLQGFGSVQTNPNLAFEVASQNAIWAAAPDPSSAAATQQALYDKYFQQMNNAAQIPSGGTGQFFGGYGGAGMGTSDPWAAFPHASLGYGMSYGGSYNSNPYSVYSFGGNNAVDWGFE